MPAATKLAPLGEVLQAAGLGKLGDAPAPEAIEAALRELARLLDGADALRRATAREAAVQAVKGAGFGSPGALVDAALGGTPKGASEGEQQGSKLALHEPEPWPDEVDGAKLLDELSAAFETYVSLREGAAVALALWCIHAHAHKAAFISPILALTSPEKRCGKSTTLTLVGALVPKPLSASNIPPAALFRAVEAFQPTLLVDEADTFLVGKNADDAMRGILNSGHLKSGAQVVRCVGDNFEPRLFSTWAPKAIALIGRLPGTLEDRSVAVALQRQPQDKKRERLRLDRLDKLEPLRQKAARWAADHMDALLGADPEVPEQLHDRAQDNWRCLLAIADKAGGEWPKHARAAARTLSGAADDGQSVGPLLLADLKGLFADPERGGDRLASAEIVEQLATREDRPWPEWKQGEPLTVRQLARLLAPFGVHPKKIRFGDTTANGYERKAFRDAWERYLPPPGLEHPEQSSNGAAFRPSADRNTIPDVPIPKSAGNPSGALIVPDVPDEKGEAAPLLALVPEEPAAEWWEP